MGGPEPAELRQPGIHFLKWFWLEAVKTALRIHSGLHETGLPQHSEVLGHRGLRHTKLTLDLSHRVLRRHQQAKNRAAVGLRYDFEDRFHAFIYSRTHIRVKAYLGRKPSGKLANYGSPASSWAAHCCTFDLAAVTSGMGCMEFSGGQYLRFAGPEVDEVENEYDRLLVMGRTVRE